MGKMTSESHHRKRHHHPVDSLCRKLQAINMMDQASNPALQIPKFQSKNFDSPQGNMKKNLEEILKKRTKKSSDSDNNTMANDTYLLSSFADNDVSSPCLPGLTPTHRRVSDIRSETFSSSKNKDKASKPWLVKGQIGASSPCLFRQGGSAFAQSCSTSSTEQNGTSSQEYSYLTSSPDLCTQEPNSTQPVFQSPVSQRLSLGKGKGWKKSTQIINDEDSDISLICEEDLLTTMFSACDVERRGKVAVSKLVDFLRYTTSRGSEDSSLEELCNMLDPDQKDISMDLETYHAIMKEWIEDCRKSWDETSITQTTTESSLGAKRTPMRMNVTSGSLEALGGDVSRGDLETSDLITCIADLQFNNQKLQEENSQLKQSLDAMEEANNRLMEESGELHNQIKSFQQSVTRIKALKEELEETKNNFSASEEKRLKMVAQIKQLEKDNQALILKISSLQEENIRNALDSDGLEKRIVELTQNMSELQMQVHLYESMLGSKDASLLKKDLDIQELKSSLKEHTSIIETLRAEKNKQENNIQQMQQELISNGIHFPLMCKFNSNILESTSSLRRELELAQGQSEVPGTELTALDESLDREVLLLLQGPERVGEKFKTTIQKLQGELSEMEELVGLTLLQAAVSEENMRDSYEKKLEAVRQNLENKKTIWIQKLDLLNAQKESLDKELIKMAGNLRRMRTEHLHLKRALSSREQEMELVRQLKEDAVLEAGILKSALQEGTKQVEDANEKVKVLENNFHRAQEEASSLQKKLEESLAEQGNLQSANAELTRVCQLLEHKTKDQGTALNSLREKYFKGLSCGVLCQSCECGDRNPLSSSKVNEEIRTEEKVSCCYQRFGNQGSQLLGLRCWCLQYTSLLDALALDSLQLIQRSAALRSFGNTRAQPTSEEKPLRNGFAVDVMLEVQKCDSNCFVGCQMDVDVASGERMDADLTKESDAEPLTDLASSEPSPFVEAFSPASESTNGSQDTDSTLLQTTEGEVSEAALSVIEEEATADANEEAKQETLLNLSGGSSSPEDLSSIAVCRNRQKTNVSPSEKEVEAEFFRLSLGFKCDLFTLEKRVRLEERSRDLAEGNLRKEIAGSLKLLDSLASLSEDNQVQEIVKKLQKSLELLNQHATRIASKAEMLGAIHQGQLNETDGSERTEKFNRRSSWGLVGAKQGEKRPLLQRYVSSPSWTESEEEQPETENASLEATVPESQGNKARKMSEKENSPPRWRLHSLYAKFLSYASSLRTTFCRTSKFLCISVLAAVFIAILSIFIMGFPFQKPAQAAPVGNGDAWTSVQQLLWPYTGLQHQGPPPV